MTVDAPGELRIVVVVALEIDVFCRRAAEKAPVEELMSMPFTFTSSAAAELVTTSITSPGPPDFVVAAYQRMKPQVWYADGQHRGYIRLELTREQLSADLVALDDVRRADSGAKILARYAIDSGTPGLRSL